MAQQCQGNGNMNVNSLRRTATLRFFRLSHSSEFPIDRYLRNDDHDQSIVSQSYFSASVS